jgi:AAA15 family ATPase/GTPase
MIVSFSVSNYRSFATEETLNFVASGRFIGSHENHVVPIPDSDQKVLRSAVLYGANGAGKSNLFKALHYVRTMALEARGRNKGTGREAFRFGDLTEQTSDFELRFISRGTLYGFGFKADDDRIVQEWLVSIRGNRERALYQRITDDNGKVTIEADDFEKGSKLAALASVGGPQNQTFLATILATLNQSDYEGDVGAVLDWFISKFTLIGPQARFSKLGTLLTEDVAFLNFASSFLKASSTGIEALRVAKRELKEDELRSLLPASEVESILTKTNGEGPTSVRISDHLEVLIGRAGENRYYLVTIKAEHEHEPGRRISLDLTDESDGTRRLLHLIPALHRLQTSGGVFFIDEIDRSLHPILVWKFLEYFLQTCENDYRQVIVTTHESNLLDLDLIRRDEIWFAEKDAKGATRLYSLSDFKIRKDLEIRKHYLQGRFGAVPFLGNLDRIKEEEQAA